MVRYYQKKLFRSKDKNCFKYILSKKREYIDFNVNLIIDLIPFKINEEEKINNYFLIKYSITPKMFFSKYVELSLNYVINFYKNRYIDIFENNYNFYQYYYSYNYFLTAFIISKISKTKVNNVDLLKIEILNGNFQFKKKEITKHVVLNKKSNNMISDFFKYTTNNSLISYDQHDNLKNLYIIFLYVEKTVKKNIESKFFGLYKKYKYNKF